MPLTRMGNGKLGVNASGNSPVVNLNIYNESGQQMDAEQNVRKNDSGGFDIDLYIKKVMLNDARINGPHTQMIANTFGLRRRTS